MQFVRSTRIAAQLRFDVLERSRVDQVAELLLAEQLAEQVTVERERLRPPLCRRRVVLVHVRGDVVEEERGRVRRGGRGLDVDHVDLPRAQALQEPLERRQVEDVLEALAVGLEDDREGRVLARDLEQRLSLQALLPERRPLARAAARDQQRAAQRSRGSASRRAPSAPPRGRRGRRARPGRSAAPRWAAARRRPGGGRRSRRPTRSTGPRARGSRAAGRRPPSPTARAPGRRTA